MTGAPSERRLEEVARARAAPADAAHDHLHVLRVTANARRIARGEGADEAICVAAALLHELFNYPKGHPDSARSGEVCAEHARAVLVDEGAAPAFVEAVTYAIRVHPFSLGVVPETLEARVLQDADRLDAIGAIGVARCFATCATMKGAFYDPADPFGLDRPLDDKRFAVDHFARKLFGLADAMHTATGRRLAEERNAFMRAYLDALGREIDLGAG